MTGFFTKKETQSTSRPDGKKHSCYSCGLFRNVKNPKMQPWGKFNKRILIIGESPSNIDDQKGIMWQGKDGVLLNETLNELGIDLFKDCLSINALDCRTNKAPKNHEIDCCRKFTLSVIKQYKPKVIIVLGTAALYSLIGHRWKKNFGSINKWRGWTIPDQDLKVWICPIFHPSYILHAQDRTEFRTVWIQDLKKAIKYRNKKFLKHKEPKIKILKENELKVLSTIKKGIAVFDYETTGLKPHAKEHKIVSASIAYTKDKCYSFLMPKKKKNLKYFTDFLMNPAIRKIAQNMKYEDTWTNVILGIKIENWYFDTIQATHILDNRSDITSLDFQTYVQFGIIDYSSEIKPYLQSVKEGGNSMNRILELISTKDGLKKLLIYGGYDSIYEYRLALIQQKQMGWDK